MLYYYISEDAVMFLSPEALRALLLAMVWFCLRATVLPKIADSADAQGLSLPAS